MTTNEFMLFETAIGWCGIVWNARAIIGVQLPEGAETLTRARVRRRFPEAQAVAVAPSHVQPAIDGIVRLLRGERIDLSEVALDMEGVPLFNRRVYEVTRAIPPGDTLTYGEIAQRLDAPGAAQAVGQALGRNPFAILVPCHRVLAAGGRMGGFSANGGVSTKRRMLAIEGARSIGAPGLFDDDDEGGVAGAPRGIARGGPTVPIVPTVPTVSTAPSIPSRRPAL